MPGFKTEQPERSQASSLGQLEFLEDLPADAKLTPEQATEAKARVDQYFDDAIRHIHEQASQAESDLRDRILNRAKLLPKDHEFERQPDLATAAANEPKPK